jgi:hypothetical protein
MWRTCPLSSILLKILAMPSASRLAALASFVALALAGPSTETFPTSGASCPVLFEGRVGLLTTPADFDKNTSVYNNQYDLGLSKLWPKD